MTSYRVLQRFRIDDRFYKQGTVQTFEEWPEDVRRERLAELAKRRVIAENIAAAPGSSGDGDVPSVEAA